MTVSVFITSYNQKDLLADAVESVLAQTRMPDEIIIADDCSGDGSQNLIRSYATEYPDLIRPIFQERNVGISLNKNAAYRATTGDWVTYLDGDDRFRPDKIEVDLETLKENPEADIAVANFANIDAEGRQTHVWCENEEMVPTGNVLIEVLARDFPKGDIFRNEMVRRSRAEEVGFYDTSLPIYEDWELRIRLLQESSLAYSHEVTSEYRRHSSSVSKSHAGRHLDASSRIYRKHRSIIESMTTTDRRYVNQRLRPWIGQFAWDAFRDAVWRRDRASAWMYLLDAMKFAPQSANARTLAKAFLPQFLVNIIRSFRR